jgi:hypothetical protein
MPYPEHEVRGWIGTCAGRRTNPLAADKFEHSADFANWLMQLNKLVGERWSGLSLLDCAERPYEDWFLDGDTPEEGLREIERDQGPELDEEVA